MAASPALIRHPFFEPIAPIELPHPRESACRARAETAGGGRGSATPIAKQSGDVYDIFKINNIDIYIDDMHTPWHVRCKRAPREVTPGGAELPWAPKGARPGG